MQKLILKSADSNASRIIAAKIGSQLKGGEVIELRSDVGGGKTTFTKGLAAGMGSNDEVRSPSFALKHEYKSEKLVLHHFDFYRLTDPGIMKNMLHEALLDDKAVIVIEWADIVKDILPDVKLTILLKAISENEREIYIEFSDELMYLIKDLTS